MIYYDGSSWIDVLGRWTGTALRPVFSKVVGVSIYVTTAYAIELAAEMNIGSAFEHSWIVGHTLSFLLVFRASSSYVRYWDGRNSAGVFFGSLRDLAMLASTLFRGGHGQYVWNHRHGEDGFSLERRQSLNDDDDRRASQARVDVCRWSLAMAVSFQIHLRLSGEGYYFGEIDEDTKWKLNWDRMRLRTLMSQEEFDVVDRALIVEDTREEVQVLWDSLKGDPQAFHRRLTPIRTTKGRFGVSMEPTYQQIIVVMNFLTQVIRLHANEPYGYKERFLPELIRNLTQVMQLHDHIHQAMTTPLPLPYVHLVRTLLVLYLFSIPFFIHYRDGLWANVVQPVMVSVALLGIDQIGTELENPFGNDANDIDVDEMHITLERELMRMLEFSGDVAARDHFTWLPVPEVMRLESQKPFFWYIALKSEVAHLEVPRRPGTTRVNDGVRVRHLAMEIAPPAQSQPSAAKASVSSSSPRVGRGRRG